MTARQVRKTAQSEDRVSAGADTPRTPSLRGCPRGSHPLTGREAAPTGPRIRPERPSDAAAIDELHLAAFDDPQLPPLVASIRSSPGWIPELALVASARDDGATILGHVIVSGTTLLADDGTSVPILMLSPLGVAPAVQNRGIGIALVRAVLERADATRPEPLTIVQGHPDYYPRFGFVGGRTIGVLPPEHLGAIDRAWMARRRPGAPAITGRVVYPPAFLELDD